MILLKQSQVFSPLLPLFDTLDHQNTHPILRDRVRNIDGYNGLSIVLDTVICATSSILKTFNEAILDPFVKTCCNCNQFVHGRPGCLRNLVFMALRTNDCWQIPSNRDDMKRVAAVAGEFVVLQYSNMRCR